MIYLISFIECFCTGLVSVNTVLYLKYILKFSESQTGAFLTIAGLVSVVVTLAFGWVIDYIGSKRAMLLGSIILIVGRLLLSQQLATPIIMSAFLLVMVGSAIKSSGVLVYIKHSNKSFKVDYVVFNIAFMLAGITYDLIKDYQLVFKIAGLVNILNLLFIFSLPTLKIIRHKVKSNFSQIKTILLYNLVMLPVSFIFTFMASILPKWVLAVLGPNAPVGKIYGSFNPFIILLIVPLYTHLSNKWKVNHYNSVIVGTALSGAAMALICLPFSYLVTTLITVGTFTIGEAIWSPNNMEVGTRLCPDGGEGKYLTINIIPRIIGNTLIGWFSSYTFQHWIYVPNPQYSMPFIIVSLFALLTPIFLLYFKRSGQFKFI